LISHILNKGTTFNSQDYIILGGGGGGGGGGGVGVMAAVAVVAVAAVVYVYLQEIKMQWLDQNLIQRSSAHEDNMVIHQLHCIVGYLEHCTAGRRF
jgi:uncharacterized membrane protein